MKLPVIQGTIRRRLLVNFRVDPAVMQKSLPSRLRPKLHAGNRHLLVVDQAVMGAGDHDRAGGGLAGAGDRIDLHDIDANLLVVRKNKTAFEDVAQALRGIPPERVLGVVFNNH